MSIEGFKIGSTNNNKIQSIESSIEKGADKVQRIADEATSEVELELDLRQPTDKEVIQQYREEGYELADSDNKMWRLYDTNQKTETIDVKILYFHKPGEEIKPVYLERNEKSGEYELIEGREEARVISLIEQTEKAIGDMSITN